MKKEALSSAEESKYIETIINAAHEALIILDQNLKVVNANDAFYKTFKLTAKDTERKFIYELGDNQWNIPRLKELLEEILPQKKTRTDYEIECGFASTGKQIMLLNAKYIQAAPKKEKMILLAIKDITNLKNAQNTLAEQSLFNQALFHVNPFGLDVVDMQGNILHINKILGDIIGDEVIGKKCWETYADNKTQCIDCPLKKEIAVGETKSIEVNNVLGGKTFKIFHTCMMYKNKKAIMESFVDITDHIKLEASLTEAKRKIAEIAEHDFLTGLPNRYQFGKVAEKFMAYAVRHKKILTILSLDLDKFKDVNDKYGHDIGDLLLKEVGARMYKNIRAEDLIARMGGDEFTIMAPGLKDKADVVRIAQKLLTVIKQPYKLNEFQLQISISIGIAFFPEDGKDITSLLKNADKAMYKAKDEGKNNYQFC
jgi:diguanylate cyclase (GGDEF)-like protein/PAS domain S-box-containing protein